MKNTLIRILPIENKVGGVLVRIKSISEQKCIYLPVKKKGSILTLKEIDIPRDFVVINVFGKKWGEPKSVKENQLLPVGKYLKDSLIAKIKTLLKGKEKITPEKKYRIDLQYWEEKSYLFGIIPIYKYHKWAKKPKTLINVFFKRKSKTCKYSPDAVIPLPPIVIGREEFARKYNNNKWLIPINYELNLDKP